MAEIEFRNVSMRFPGVAAVADLSLRVQEGEFLTLLGPSGCGKSTTLNLIAGLLEPSAGKLYIGGRLVNGVAPKDRRVAMVFQDYALYPHLTVAENLAFPLQAAKLPKTEIARKVRGVAEGLGLEPLLDRLPKALSGGQRQRVALGRALVREPQAFLMDEPLSNLDARLRVAMRAELKRLHRQLKATIIYVTHDQAEAMTLSDRIAVLKEGVLQQVGTPREIYERPANQFVAGFMGSVGMNFVSCRLEATAGGGVLARGAFRLLPTARQASLIREQGIEDIVVGVRPEHITLIREAQSGTPMRVELVEYLGSEELVHLLADGIRLVARMEPDRDLVPDKLVHVQLDASRATIFDARTQNRIGE